VRLTLIQPCMGRQPGESYIRSWQMEPLAPALLSALTPKDIEVKFYDDRLETIPYREPTDLVAITVETYTAKRAYQIADIYRKRGVPVVVGGYHPTLQPDEAAGHADAVVVGEAEIVWARLIQDVRRGELRPRYSAKERCTLSGVRPDRKIFAGKNYLPIGLVESSRGCAGQCEFCSIQVFSGQRQVWKPVTEVVEEVAALRNKLIFFVDDNIYGDRERAKALFQALRPLKVGWLGQASLDLADDPEMLCLARQSGCSGLLVGIESLNRSNLQKMHKAVNLGRDSEEYAAAMQAFSTAGIRLYPTFLFGYEKDDATAVRSSLQFAARHRTFLAAFNHLTPFPGTPLYRRLQDTGRLRFPAWWLDPDYRYGMVPFAPERLSAQELEDECVRARREFFGLPSIVRRAVHFRVNCSGVSKLLQFALINLMMRGEVRKRQFLPLGVETGDFEGWADGGGDGAEG